MNIGRSYPTFEISKNIKVFLIENRGIFNISKLTLKLGIKKKILLNLMCGEVKTLNPEVIKKILPFLKSLGFRDNSEKDIKYISDIVCSYFNVSVDMLQTKTRKHEIVQARQVAMYFSKNRTKSSLATIGSQIGDKDHATVIHACKTVNNLLDTDKKFKKQFEEIERMI